MTAMRVVFAVLLLAGAAAVGAEPPESIRLPSGPVVPDRMPAPPAVGTLKVTPDTLYVFDCDVPVLVLTSPPGVLSVTEEKGPLKIRGRFSEEPQRVQTKTFAGKSVFTVEALKDGVAEILVVPVGATDPAKVVRRLVEAQTGPRPPPTPTPDPKPEPKPDPKVDPAPDPKPKDVPLSAEPAGLRVLIVYDPVDPKTGPAHREVIFGADVRKHLDANCVKGPDGKTPEYRIYPTVALTDVAGEEKVWRDALARKRPSLPWCVISNGRTFYEGPLPAGKEAFVAEAEKHK